MKTNKHPFISTALILAGVPAVAAPSYQEEVAFLKKHTDIIELSSGSARVAIAPAWQGRVMTSTANGPDGGSFGWINPEIIAAGIKPEAERTGLTKHIHVFGGEERFWFGPEGGPFSVFFPPKVEQIFANWKTPAIIDTEAFETAAPPTADSATFKKSAHLPNRAGTVFSMDLKRKVTLATVTELAGLCGGTIPEGVKSVGYITENLVKNSGKNEWTRQTGAPSIWMLGMFKPSPGTTIVIPFKPGDAAELGPIANTAYFGEIPQSRIKFGKSALFFKGDGKERGKLGIPPKRSLGIAGSWQSDTGTLTLVRIPPNKNDAGAAWPYVDSQWKEDVDPFGGDLLNAYNDGPPEPGAKALGPFYELETSSPALFLKPGESHTHTQFTVHLTGPREKLDAIAKRTLGVDLDTIEGAW
ncbi:MAG: DUF6786 family protein [Verrucomicrobiota bacterium]